MYSPSNIIARTPLPTSTSYTVSPATPLIQFTVSLGITRNGECPQSNLSISTCAPFPFAAFAIIS